MGAFNSWNVVDNFDSVLKNLCEENTKKYFSEQILNNSKINLSANEQIADEIYELDKKIIRTKKSVSVNNFWMLFMRIFGGILFAIGIILIVIGAYSETDDKISLILIGVFVGIVIGALLFGLSWLVKKKKDMFKSILNSQEDMRQKKFDETQIQLSDLYAHLHDKMTFDIFQKTFSNVKFDDYLNDIDAKKWIPYLESDNDSSTIFAISGDLGNNPFIVSRIRKTAMYMEIYTGSVTVMVRRTRTIDGKTESYMAPKIIVATARNPAPKYWTETKLLYLTSITRDVSFQNMAPFKNENKAIKFFKKSKEMSTMDNPQFDKMFPCNRDNEIGFRTIWTPMAQEEMIKLLHVKNDYVFIKDKEINIIESPTFNQHDLYYLANRYYGYFDYRKIRDDFINFNINFFNAIYFMLAPILTIPIYQQTRYFDLSSKKGDKGYSCYAMESKINLSLDKDIYVHPDSKTENIFKVNRIVLKNNVETDEVIAYGYRTSFRTVVVTVVDFEAGTVLVPVIVIDYISVSKKTNIENRILDISKDNANKQKMNFAIASAIVAASMPSDSVPNKEELLKNNPESNRKKRTKK